MDTSDHTRHVLMTLQGSIQRAEGESQKAWAALVNDHREDAQLVFDVREKLIDAANMLEAKMWPGRKFPLGRLVLTPGASAALDNPQEAEDLLERHANGDWGDLDAEDKATNDRSIDDGGRILSKYVPQDGTPLYVITEGDRSATTMMRTDEY